MAQSIPAQTLPVVASGAVTKRRFVTVAGAQAGTGAHTLGVSRYTAASGEELPVDNLGTTEVEAGGQFAAGAPLTPDALGHAVLNERTQPVEVTVMVAGAAAGDVVVEGILATDELVAVFVEDAESGVQTDLTAEFEVADDDTINNEGGTSSAGDTLLVVYRRPALPTVARALEAASGAGDIVEVLLIPN